VVSKNKEELSTILSIWKLTFVIHSHINNVVAVFFDLEKAYDMTWKYGILRGLKIVELKNT